MNFLFSKYFVSRVIYIEPESQKTPFTPSPTESMRDRTAGALFLKSSESRTEPATACLTPSAKMGEIQDLICIGFGPASLAIAIALQETSFKTRPKVSFLERQLKFGWHAGMQLPGAKMQISFLKDLATPRNPQSKFTFLSYLYAKNRLNTFINLGTFLPSRKEYEDYLGWIAEQFEEQGLVAYGQEVLEVSPSIVSSDGKVTRFKVVSRDAATSKIITRLTKRVVIAVGGKPIIPAEFPQHHPAVVHSSKYSTQVHSALPDATKAYNIAVIGGGQSAAEIFNDLPSRYPNATVTMIIKSSALRPSDDSPFVNEVFDPERVDEVYQQPADVRARAILTDRATNYSVVRLELIEHLYEKLYTQRLLNPDPASFKIKIASNRQVVKSHMNVGLGNQIRLQLKQVIKGLDQEVVDESMVVDAVFVATGYLRNAHEDILANSRNLLAQETAAFSVRRDYRVDFDEGRVAEDAGVWLQGCNEKTHGLSDTLLSILAIRGGEIVKSMFGGDRETLQLRSKL
ncbi:L-lysine 6-monooxygenase (NADPH-requiring)-domain-containing protein [Calycina marina]|uniref:L-ornithine N(5)-monooxygenase [NAD(P)H] n=1 Tax=Calycina marina TaxID=1763456 RepID=A0A9P8CIP6_9HELO|nr:L-lysine 6-monooxygenase (NADPH-requiring)-domain-containing protein [Calycina marina]